MVFVLSYLLVAVYANEGTQYCEVDEDCGDLPYKLCGRTIPNVCEHK